ncbi:hypothetical protein [Ktedonospora formicarum]|uniref:Uncharacterized protein n=1 Tax=Ktedonospora formicarum TaxID=2778364 RepID=A0A8J3MRS6_9CHLR|nr:hypothetical protein [Ktedonospora formicarum]GHO44111.1 hypothetical protein KSX_22740 [Ktedonospora formicarum]
MATNESDQVKRIRTATLNREATINYALLKLIHHEFGNGLAVLSGYRYRLQHAISEQKQEASSPARDVRQDRDERWLGYLQTMQDREMRMKNLLFELRDVAPDARNELLCKHFIRTDLVVLLGLVIQQRISLCPDYIVQVNTPAQPLFVMCDPFWLQVLLEHFFLNYIVAGHIDIVPAEIQLEPIGREAKVTLRLRSDLLGLTSRRDEVFEAEMRDFEQGDLESCHVLCNEILHEHRGRIWSEQEGSISLALPLAEE